MRLLFSLWGKNSQNVTPANNILSTKNIEEKTNIFLVFLDFSFFFFFTKLWIKNIDVDVLPEVAMLCQSIRCLAVRHAVVAVGDDDGGGDSS
jgi:hypothetical protein